MPAGGRGGGRGQGMPALRDPHAGADVELPRR